MTRIKFLIIFRQDASLGDVFNNASPIIRSKGTGFMKNFFRKFLAASLGSMVLCAVFFLPLRAWGEFSPTETAPPPPTETSDSAPFLSAESNVSSPPSTPSSSVTPIAPPASSTLSAAAGTILSAPNSAAAVNAPSPSVESVPPTAQRPSPESVLVTDSRIILDEIMAIPVKGIPANLLQKAEGLAFFPQMVKGGFIVGIQRGNGVLVVKNEKGLWEYPRFVTLTGGSLGFQAGVQTADVILVFCSRRSVESALAGKFTIGVDASVSAGPVGRQTSAATDYQLSAEIYSYSRSRGLFLGASIDGSVMENNGVGNYYQNGVPEEAKSLLDSILRYSKPEEPKK